MFPPYNNSSHEDYYPISSTLDANDQPVLTVSRDCVDGQLYYNNSDEYNLPQTVYPHSSSSLSPRDDYQRYRQPGLGRNDSNQLFSNHSPYLVSKSPHSRYRDQFSYPPLYDSSAYFSQNGMSQLSGDASFHDLTRNSIVYNESLYPRQAPEISFSRGYPVRYTRSTPLVSDYHSSPWPGNSLPCLKERSFSTCSPSISTRGQENRNGIRNLCYRSLVLNPLYGRLLSSSLSKESQLLMESLIRDISVRDAADRVTRQCISFKKQCTVNKSRLLFILFLLKYPQQTQTWLEFARMEMEAGCYDNALCVINTAINAIPDNLLLLTKKLRILEKLTDTKGICDLIQRLRQINSQRAVKVTVDAAQVLAKLGEERASWSLFCEVGSNPATYSGWLFLRILKYCQVMCPYEETNQLILDILYHSPKHGPLWTLSLDLIESFSILCCPIPLPECSSINSLYDEITRLASQVLPMDILWKVYYSRICHDTRLLNYFRYCAFLLIEPSEYESRLHYLTSQLFQDVAMTLRICPPSLQWKVYMTLGRDAAVASYYQAARLIMQRGIRNCPIRYQHYLLLEYSKIEFYAGHADTSA